MSHLHDEALRAVAQRLGARAAERIDVEATAAAVVERLKQAPAADRRWIAPPWLRIAAALLLVISAALLARALGPGPADQITVLSTGADLQGLSTSELEALLASLDQTLNLAVPQPDSSSEGLDELTPDELRAVLRTLEG
ncbi:MAG TPA: hypothetical protein VGA20_01330 [Gemmatimonadales bacterium]